MLMRAHTGELAEPTINADSSKNSALFKESISPGIKIYSDELLELRASIKTTTNTGKLKAIRRALAVYQEKYPFSGPVKDPESDVENLLNPQEKLLEAIESFARAIEMNIAINQAKKAVIEAYQKFEDSLEEKQEESDENKKLSAAIRALEISRAENAKYLAINAALEKFEDDLKSEATEEALKSKATEEALQGIAAEELRKSIKALEPKTTDYWRYLSYLGIILSSAIILATCFLTLSLAVFISTALPWVLLATTIALAANYTKQSFNSKVTAGRGFAILIALATAVLAFISMQSVFILPVAIVFATGCFLANLILYRANVPNVLNALASNLKRPGRITWAKSKRFLLSPFRRFDRSLMILAGIITGFVLTVGMWHSWLAVFPVVGALGVLSAPYIFFPLMIVLFVANSAFVYRGLTRFVNAVVNCLKVYRNGLLLVTDKDGKDKYVILKPEDDVKDENKTYRGLWAVFAYFVEFKPKDSVGRVIFKSICYALPKLALVALIASISQIAVVSMSMNSIGEVLPFVQGVGMNIIQYIAYAAAYSSRISFIMSDLLVNATTLVNFCYKKCMNFSYKEFMELICNKEKRTAFFNTIKEKFSLQSRSQRLQRLSQDLGNLTGAFQKLIKEQTQDHAIIDVWRATAGDNWKKLWERQIKVDWREASFLKKTYCLFKAIIIVAMRLFSFPAIICNTVSNAYIATYKGSSSAEGLFSTPSKATLGGVSSAGLVFFSAKSLSEEQNKKMSPRVSSDKITYELKTRRETEGATITTDSIAEQGSLGSPAVVSTQRTPPPHEPKKAVAIAITTDPIVEQGSLGSPAVRVNPASTQKTPPPRELSGRHRTPFSTRRSRNSSSFFGLPRQFSPPPIERPGPPTLPGVLPV